jgi:uncharacterized OsmC-like protein
MAGRATLSAARAAGSMLLCRLYKWRLLLMFFVQARAAKDVISQGNMNRDELKAAQDPLKAQYRTDPTAALITLRAHGNLDEGVTCSVETGRALVKAGLHPATGGAVPNVCSGDMLLQALVACAGVTLSAVATSLGIAVRSATLTAEGDLDFRGTLGVSKEVPVGFSAIRLLIDLDADITAELKAKLLQLTERYCVVYQTLKNSPQLQASFVSG